MVENLNRLGIRFRYQGFTRLSLNAIGIRVAGPGKAIRMAM